jgi:anaerobic magnesium-protoporphyrin IX monomethyl ester cyclase
MKTLVLNPPHYITAKYGQKGFEVGNEDILSIGYVGAYAASRGHTVDVVDMYTWSWERCTDFITKFHPDIVAIACAHSVDRGSAYKVARFVKELGSAIKVVFGGHHSSAMAGQIVRHLPVDVVVVGEGEETFEELIRTWENNGDIHQVKGLVFMEGDELVETPERPPIKNLDILPFPIRGEIPRNRSVASTYPSPLPQLKYNGKSIGSRIYASMATSRGCPYKCQFCSVTTFWGARWRMRSPQNVVDEIEVLVEKHGVQHINFLDDIFTTKPERVIEICQEIIRRGIEITWGNMTRVDSVSEDMAYWMRKSGCVWTSFGIETGDDVVMKNINKEINNERVIRAFDIFKRQGIATIALMMVGNPGETRASIEETKKLMRRIRPDLIVAAKTMVMPATELYERAKSAGLVDADFWLTDVPPPYFTVEHDEAQLNLWVDEVSGATTTLSGSFFGSILFDNSAARIVRDWFDEHTGVRLTRKGLQLKHRTAASGK